MGLTTNWTWRQGVSRESTDEYYHLVHLPAMSRSFHSVHSVMSSFIYGPSDRSFHHFPEEIIPQPTRSHCQRLQCDWRCQMGIPNSCIRQEWAKLISLSYLTGGMETILDHKKNIERRQLDFPDHELSSRHTLHPVEKAFLLKIIHIFFFFPCPNCAWFITEFGIWGLSTGWGLTAMSWKGICPQGFMFELQLRNYLRYLVTLGLAKLQLSLVFLFF